MVVNFCQINNKISLIHPNKIIFRVHSISKKKKVHLCVNLKCLQSKAQWYFTRSRSSEEILFIAQLYLHFTHLAFYKNIITSDYLQHAISHARDTANMEEGALVR